MRLDDILNCISLIERLRDLDEDALQYATTDDQRTLLKRELAYIDDALKALDEAFERAE